MKKLLKIFIVLLLVSGMVAESEAATDKQKKKKEEKVQIQAAGSSSAAVAMLIEAKKEEITGNPKKAMDLYKSYISKYPDGAPGYYELGRMSAENRQLDDAQKYAEKAAGLDPGNRWYQLFLAQTYQMKGNYKEAIAVYHDLTVKYPRELDNFYNLASLYLITGRYRDAIGVYDLIEKKVGISEEMSLQKEKIFLEMKDTKNAQQELEKLVTAFPDNTKYLSILAEFFMSDNQKQKAYDIYQKVLALDPGNPYIHISLAEYYRKSGDTEKAFDELEKGFANPNLDIDTKVNILLSFLAVSQSFEQNKYRIFDLADILVKTHPDDPKAYSIKGDLLLQDDKLKESREQFLKVIALDSSKYVVWEQLLQLDLQLEKYNDLAVHSRRATELFPEQPLPFMLGGIAYYQLTDYASAVKMLERGAKLVVNNDEFLSQFYMYLGDAYHAMNQAAESDKAYEKSLQIKGDNAYVLNNYSYYLTIRGIDLKKAEEMAKKAVTLEPKNSAFQDTYGWVLYKLGKFDEAKEWIAKAVKEDPDGVSAEVLEHYGDVLYQLGDHEKALVYWLKAREKGKGSDLLDKKISEKKLFE